MAKSDSRLGVFELRADGDDAGDASGGGAREDGVELVEKARVGEMAVRINHKVRKWLQTR
jgi:hypothetical protein